MRTINGYFTDNYPNLMSNYEAYKLEAPEQAEKLGGVLAKKLAVLCGCDVFLIRTAKSSLYAINEMSKETLLQELVNFK